MTRRLVAFAGLMLVASAAIAQELIPTPAEYLGYKPGAQFTTHDRILDYFGELARRSPRLTLQTFGQTYEGRPLVLATITSEKNRAALEDIRRNVVALAEPDNIDVTRAAEIARTTPAVVWLAFGVHGNESSSAEVAMLVASTLLGDAQAAGLLDDLVVLIDPLQNPDGRERYVQWYGRVRGVESNPSPDAFEHHEPWPGGRFNHYLIDLNRDWSWMSQRETRARVAMFRQWRPQVFVDFHEMGYRSSYFFPPSARPVNANLPRQVDKWLDTFGRANAEAFSNRGWQFFVGERFDLFYPGYGDSWPSLSGAIGMTYEVAGGGRAGIVVEREEGLLTLAERIDRHYTSAMATLRTAAANREGLLRYTYDAMRASLDGARNTYLLLPGSPNSRALVDTLQQQGVRVSMLTAPVTLRATRIDGKASESRPFPAGTAVVSTRQPLGALATTLLERNAQLGQQFVDEQRAKSEADEPDDFYDLTTWSMPLAMNVEAYVTNANVTGPLSPWAVPAVRPVEPASYGYLVSGLDPNVYRFAGRLLKDEVRFSVADAELAAGEETWPRGTLVILKGSNKPDLDAIVARVAAGTGATVVPLSSGWVGRTTFGSEKLRLVRKPRIALVGGPPAAPTSYGVLWQTLDVDTPIPYTAVTADSIPTLDLGRYNVLVFPDGNYSYAKPVLEKLQAWVRNGGTLIAVKRANTFLRDKDVEISKVKRWEPPKKSDDDKEGPAQEERYNEFRVPGSAFRTMMSERSYLTFGIPRPPAVLIQGTDAFLPSSRRIDNIVTVDPAGALVSGIAWPESIERISGSAWLVNERLGRGNVITFADEPHFRLFWRATLPMFLNAVTYSPSFSR
ncbi:MAG TPA: M14 family metallopeptidase [Thermoanaerobaculia bacterium]|nr:M14 family metallopeptidase [Thermoanaerobaculia bacterium]